MRWPLLALALSGAPFALAAQGGGGETLEEAANQARRAWIAHDPQALVGQSASIVLQIPGADPSSPLGRSQAVALLQRHFQSAGNEDLTITAVREMDADGGFVELERRYVVRGTTDVRRETVFLGFRRVSGQWRLAEVRSTS